MRADAGLHADQAGREVGEPRFHLDKRFHVSNHMSSPLTPPSPRKERGEGEHDRVSIHQMMLVRCFTPSPRLRGEGGVRGAPSRTHC